MAEPAARASMPPLVNLAEKQIPYTLDQPSTGLPAEHRRNTLPLGSTLAKVPLLVDEGAQLGR